MCIQHKINTTKKLIKLILNSAFNFSRILKICFCYCHILKNDLNVLKLLLLKVTLLLSSCAYRNKIYFPNSSFLSLYIYGIFDASGDIKFKSHQVLYIDIIQMMSVYGFKTFSLRVKNKENNLDVLFLKI